MPYFLFLYINVNNVHVYCNIVLYNTKKNVLLVLSYLVNISLTIPICLVNVNKNLSICFSHYMGRLHLFSGVRPQNCCCGRDQWCAP